MRLPETYLIEVLSKDSLLNILTLNNKINNQDYIDYLKKLVNWACENQQQTKTNKINLKKFKLSNDSLITQNKLSDSHTSLGHLLGGLKNIMASDKTDEKTAKLVQQTTLEILAELSKMPIPKNLDEPELKASEENNTEESEDNTEDSEKPVDTASSGKRDWTAYKAKKLANAKVPSEAIKEFYDEYYQTVFAGANTSKPAQDIIEKLKSLEKVLIPEFSKLGYNPEVNPFVQFLKSLIEHKYNIFEKLTMTRYGAIHNAFIDKDITGNMLGNYEKYKDTTLLFCSNLYNYNGREIVEYLSLQKQIRTAAAQNTDIQGNLVAKILIQQDISEDKDFSEKVKALEALEKPISPNDANAKVASETEIRELYQYFFGASLKIKVNNKTGDDILAAVKKSSQIKLLNMLQYFLKQEELDNLNLKAETVQAARKLLKEKGFGDKELGSQQSDVCKEILNDYIINDEAAQIIAGKIVAVYQSKDTQQKKAETTN